MRQEYIHISYVGKYKECICRGIDEEGQGVTKKIAHDFVNKKSLRFYTK